MADPVEIPVGPERKYISGLHAAPIDKAVAELSKRLVIMMHGFPGAYKQGHNDFFGDLELLFTHAGLHSFRFDFRGCGSSEGLQEEFCLQTADEDVAAVLDWAEKQGFEELILVGEGIGAIPLLKNLTPQVKVGFLFWPVLDGKAFLEHTQIESTDKNHSNNSIGQTFINDMKELDLKEILSNLNAPLLVQYPANDEKIGPEHMDVLRNHASSTRRLDLTGYEDGVHGLPDERHRKMISFHLGQFLSKYV
jgi:pimeloyl-ACP methyl ester carboxylesterase